VEKKFRVFGAGVAEEQWGNGVVNTTVSWGQNVKFAREQERCLSQKKIRLAFSVIIQVSFKIIMALNGSIRQSCAHFAIGVSIIVREKRIK
jgi:hypothetical protein